MITRKLCPIKNRSFFLFGPRQTGVEVDFVLVQNQKVVAAIEVKSSENITSKDTYGLREFQKEHQGVPAYIIAPIEKARQLNDDLQMLPWQELPSIIQHLA